MDTRSAYHHPKALPYLFLTELWERFGFYIVQGLLILYITKYFGYTDAEGYTILGVFTALAYIAPLFGGYLANKVIGYSNAIILGGLFLMLGYFLLALPLGRFFLFPALATIITGNGLFKPNVSSILGSQYREGDPNRDAGYTIFYVGINIGAFLAGASAGYIQEAFGWHVSFMVAGIGLIIGLCTFIFGLRHIRSDQTFKLSFSFRIKLFLYCILAIIGLTFLLKIYALADILLPVVGVILLVGLIFLTLRQPREQQRKMIVLNILILSSIVYWMLFLQMFSSANLFVARLVDRDFFGFHLSTTLFWGSESVFIILLGPFFAIGWKKLTQYNKNPPALLKFSLAILVAGLGFLVLACSTYFPGPTGLINPLWVFAAYFLITIGELLLSPIGLSAVTMLAPPTLVGLMMGVWFVATGFGGVFSGMIAEFASVPPNVIGFADKLHIYQNAFFTYAYIGFFVAIILFFLQIAGKKFLTL